MILHLQQVFSKQFDGFAHTTVVEHIENTNGKLCVRLLNGWLGTCAVFVWLWTCLFITNEMCLKKNF